jgi:hypothetical protein
MFNPATLPQLPPSGYAAPITALYGPIWKDARRTSAQLREKNTTSASAASSSSPSRPGFSTSTLTLASGFDRLSHWTHCNVVPGMRPCALSKLEHRALPYTLPLHARSVSLIFSRFAYLKVEPRILPVKVFGGYDKLIKGHFFQVVVVDQSPTAGGFAADDVATGWLFFSLSEDASREVYERIWAKRLDDDPCGWGVTTR